MKKILALVLALCMAFALCAVGGSASADNTSIKFGLITLHDENSTYDANFINAANQMVEDLKAEGIDVELVVATGIDEGEDCYEKACDLADEGCDIVMADSFGHEDYMIEAAKEYPEVQFLHATGTKAHTEELDNYHNAFATIYEGRYLAGVAAGLKLQEMIDAGEVDAENAKVGYVGAYTYAEVISGYTSWFLGVRSVVPTATMEVSFTGSWYDETAEKEAANALIEDGCVLISQHADSMGAPTACETAGVPDVTYNVSTESACPNTYIAGCKVNWAPYFEYAVKCVLNGEEISDDYIGDFSTGSVEMLEIGAAAAEGTAEKLEEVKAQLEAGEISVFDCANFTVTVDVENNVNVNATVDEDGHLTAYMADVDGDYVGDTDVIVDGVFAESAEGFRSAPYFDIQIDGISLINTKF